MRRHKPEPVIGAWDQGPVEFILRENADHRDHSDCERFFQVQVPAGEAPFRRAPYRRRVADPLLGQD